jgi:hypothetical protein
MRRFIVLVTVAAMLAAMLMVAGPASAQGGCQEFGQAAAFVAQETGGLGEEASAAAPVNDDVHFLQEMFCS